MKWRWSEIAPRKLAKAIRLLSVDCGGESVYVYMRDGFVTACRQFRNSDDFVGTYTSTAEDAAIVHDLTEAAWAEISRRRIA